MLSHLTIAGSLSLSVVGCASITVFLIYYTGWIIYTRFFHPYHDIPDPFLASITSWHRSRALRYGIKDDLQQGIHNEYGTLVRIAPDEVQISDPHATDTIYRSDFLKTKFYDGFNPNIDNRPEPFAERNEHIHAQHRKIIAPLFRAEAISEYESNLDTIISLFCMKVESLIGEEFDLAKYTVLLSWDVTGDMIYGHHGGFGLLLGEPDYMGWQQMIKIMPYAVSSLGYVPYGLRNLYFVSQLLLSGRMREGLVSAMTVIKQVKALVKQRRDEEDAGSVTGRHDWLSKMMTMSRDEKLDFNDGDIGIMLNAFVWAGSDTSGSTLAMIMACIVQRPKVYAKLQAEVDSMMQERSTIKYQDAAKMPYLTACVKEGVRCHTVVGAALPRYVPPGGAEICGRIFPGGYKVQVNQTVLHRNKDIFGEDANDFRPERWIDSDEDTIKRMNKHLHPFGYGTRVCLGQHIAFHEIYKFIPTVMSRFRFDYKSGPDVSCGLFQQPSNLQVTASQRKP